MPRGRAEWKLRMRKFRSGPLLLEQKRGGRLQIRNIIGAVTYKFSGYVCFQSIL